MKKTSTILFTGGALFLLLKLVKKSRSIENFSVPKFQKMQISIDRVLSNWVEKKTDDPKKLRHIFMSYVIQKGSDGNAAFGMSFYQQYVDCGHTLLTFDHLTDDLKVVGDPDKSIIETEFPSDLRMGIMFITVEGFKRVIELIMQKYKGLYTISTVEFTHSVLPEHSDDAKKRVTCLIGFLGYKVDKSELVNIKLSDISEIDKIPGITLRTTNGVDRIEMNPCPPHNIENEYALTI